MPGSSSADKPQVLVESHPVADIGIWNRDPGSHLIMV